MENEEKYIREKVGQDNPFRVPDGYFTQLSDQVMNMLPERQQRSLVLSFRTFFYSAASFLFAAILGVTIYFHQEEKQQQQFAVTTETNTEDTYIDEMADYAMIDNAEIFACLSDN